jgi:hypothetical protein
MSTRILRFFLSGLLCLSIAGLAACGDDGDGNNRDNAIELACEGNWDCSTGEMCLEGDCVPDTTPWCDSKYDCAAGEICDGGICAAEGSTCIADEDCAVGRICGAENTCVDGCRRTAECTDGKACLDDNTCGACVNDSQCMAGDVCTDGKCEAAEPAQCQSVGESCDPDAAISEGFVCEDLGNGPVCLESCIRPPAGGFSPVACTWPETDTCTAGTYCSADLGAEGYCVASECSGLLDAAGCADEVAANPDAFPNGAECVAVYDTVNGARVDRSEHAFICEPRNTGRELGETCNNFIPCGPGLACGYDGTCQEYCTSDTDCEDGLSCLTDDTGDATGAVGWGVCGNGCEPYGDPRQCGEGMVCDVLSPDDGVCRVKTGTVPAYGDCSSGGTCVTGTTCLALVSGGARCYPSCDPTLGTQAASDATCPGGNLSGFARFINLAESVGPVDFYVNGERVVRNRPEDSDANFPISRTYLNLKPGDVVVDVTEARSLNNDAPLASLTATLDANEQTSFVLIETADGLELLAIDVPRSAPQAPAGQVSARLALDVDFGTPVDVYVGISGQPLVPTPVLEDVAYQATSEFAAPVPAGAYDLHLFAAGADPATAGALAVLGVNAPAGALITVHVWGQFDAAGSLTDTGATTVLYREAAMTSAGGSCVQLNFGSSRTAFESGICFQKSPGPDAIGTGLCTAEGDTAVFWAYDFVCLPSAGIPVGDACAPGLNPCEAGAYCRENGSGQGVCTSYCEPGGSDNPLLQCANGYSCMPIDGTDMGECRIQCAPDANYGSGACSTPGLEACVPHEGAAEPAFCEPSGNIAVGEACGDPSVNNCSPNAVCRSTAGCNDLNTVISAPVRNPGGGICRQRCELFVEDGGCPAGQACMIDVSTVSTHMGFCQPADPALADLKSLDPCPLESAGMMCGNGSICIDEGESAICLQFCELDSDRGCGVNQECAPLFGSGVKLGYCIPE